MRRHTRKAKYVALPLASTADVALPLDSRSECGFPMHPHRTLSFDYPRLSRPCSRRLCSPFFIGQTTICSSRGREERSRSRDGCIT